MNNGAMVVVLAGLSLAVQEASPQTPSPDAKAAFERIKALAGTWEGTVTAKDGPPTTVRYEVTAAGSVVMETMFPGTEHEMRSLYHLDGGTLVLTHYCAIGKEPRMRLAPSASRAGELVFEFAGATNLDPEKDTHMHSGRIVFVDPERIEVDPERIESEWTVYQGRRQTGSNRFFLRRKR